MENKGKLWLWILVGILGVGAIGVGVWLGLNQGAIQYARDYGVLRLIEDVILSKDDLKETELMVSVLAWDEEGAVISFTGDKQIGKFAISAIETELILKAQVEEGNGLNGLIGETLLSTLSPYWKNAFCVGDTVLMELEESAIGLKKDLEKIESKDVIKITNLGPSECREIN